MSIPDLGDSFVLARYAWSRPRNNLSGIPALILNTKKIFKVLRELYPVVLSIQTPNGKCSTMPVTAA